MFAHGLQKYYKPIRDYITFDWETVEERTTIDIGECKKIVAKIHPHTVAATTNKDTPIYFDIRTEGWINKFIAKLFEHANILVERNRYSIPGVPEEIMKKINLLATNDVTILGFNSAKFDMHLFLKYLNSSEWSVDSAICSNTNMRMIRVTNKGFKDVENKAETKNENSEEDPTCDPEFDYDDEDNEMYDGYDDDSYGSNYKDYKKVITLVFRDSMNYFSPGTLDQHAKDFGGVDNAKSHWAYEAYHLGNYMEVLSSTEPFPKEAFFSTLKNKPITDEEYEEYTKERAKLYKNKIVKNK
jgi:hypothetical protein